MNIRVTSTSNLIAFLKKLKVVDRSVLLELQEDRLFSKVHTPDKSVMKYASISNTHIFDTIENWDEVNNLTLGKEGPQLENLPFFFIKI